MPLEARDRPRKDVQGSECGKESENTGARTEEEMRMKRQNVLSARQLQPASTGDASSEQQQREKLKMLTVSGGDVTLGSRIRRRSRSGVQQQQHQHRSSDRTDVRTQDP